MVPLHFLAQDNLQEVQHGFSGYVTISELAQHDANGIINGPIGFIRSK